MRLTWPFRRRRAPVQLTGGATVMRAAEPSMAPAGHVGRQEWQELPPLHETLEPPPLVAPAAPFRDSLAGAHLPPPIIQPLGHERTADGPAGTIAGVATPVSTLPAQRSAEAELNAPLRRWPRRPAHQSLAALGESDGDRSVVDAQPRSAEPPSAELPAPFVRRPAVLAEASAASSIGALTRVHDASSLADAPAVQRTHERAGPSVTIEYISADQRGAPPLVPTAALQRKVGIAPGRPAGAVRHSRLGSPVHAEMKPSTVSVQRSATPPSPSGAGAKPPTTAGVVERPSDGGPRPSPATFDASGSTLADSSSRSLQAPLVIRTRFRPSPDGSTQRTVSRPSELGRHPSPPQIQTSNPTTSAPAPAPSDQPAAPGSGKEPAGASEPARFTLARFVGTVDPTRPRGTRAQERAITIAPEPQRELTSIADAPALNRVAVQRTPTSASPTGSVPGPASRAGSGLAAQSPSGRSRALQRSVDTRAATDDAPIVRRDETASIVAAGIGGRAFTLGGDIYVPPATGSLGDSQGRALMAHELTHVRQQRELGPAQPTTGTESARNLETEARQAESWSLFSDMTLAPSAPREATPAGQPDAAAAGGVGSASAAGSALGLFGGSEPGAHVSAAGVRSDGHAPLLQAADEAGVTPAPASAPSSGGSERDLEDLVRKIYPRLRHRLASELLVARERAGSLTDIR